MILSEIADMQSDVQKLAREIALSDYGVNELGNSEDELATEWTIKLLRLVLKYTGQAVDAERQAIIQAINAPDAFPQSRTGWDAGDALDAVVELIYARGRKSSNL